MSKVFWYVKSAKPKAVKWKAFVNTAYDTGEKVLFYDFWVIRRAWHLGQESIESQWVVIFQNIKKSIQSSNALSDTFNFFLCVQF